MAVSDDVRALLQGVLGDSGLVLDDVTVGSAGRRRLVTVVVDRAFDASGDVTEQVPALGLDEVSDATRLISSCLDDSDVLADEPYTLEVTSPGVGRLTASRHFQRNVGRLVSLRPLDGPAVTGRIVRAGPGDLTIEVPATKREPGRREDHLYAMLEHAEVQVEFSRPAADDTRPRRS